MTWFPWRQRGTQYIHEILSEESQLYMIMKNLPVILFVIDTHGIFKLSKGRNLEALYLTQSDVLGRSVFDVYEDHPEVLDQIKRAIHNTTQNLSFSEDIQIGNSLYFITYSKYEIVITKEEYLLGVALDVTSERMTQKALEEAKEHFQLLFETNRTAPTLVIDPENGRICNVNQAAIEFYGWSSEILLKKTIFDLRTVTRDEVQANIDYALTGEQPYFRSCHLLASGKMREVEVYTAPLKEAGHVFLYSVMHDVTARSELEHALKITDAVFETGDPMLIMDEHHIVIRVNETFCQVTGYSTDELLGQIPPIMRSQLYDTEFFEHIWSTIAEYGWWQGEILSKRKSGEVFPEWVTIRAVYDQKNQIVTYVEAFVDLSIQREMELTVQRLSRIDALTGLLNRSSLLKELEVAVLNVGLSGAKGALLLLDIDNFKDINDTLGQASGDQLLLLLAERLKQEVPLIAYLARFAADEFAILLPKIESDMDDIQEFLSKMMERNLTQEYMLGDKLYFIAVTIGGTVFSSSSKSALVIEQEADIALHAAKQQGKSSIVWFKERMAIEREEAFQVTEGLRHALELEQLELYVQSQVYASGQPFGVEVLLRWKYQGKVLGPDRFIPIAESTGIIVSMGAWVLEQSCRLLRIMQRTHPLMRISVNVSPKQFYEVDFVDMVIKTLARWYVDPTSVTLEVTETLLMHDRENSILLQLMNNVQKLTT